MIFLWLLYTVVILSGLNTGSITEVTLSTTLVKEAVLKAEIFLQPGIGVWGILGEGSVRWKAGEAS